jgi:hypothetical protein
MVRAHRIGLAWMVAGGLALGAQEPGGAPRSRAVRLDTNVQLSGFGTLGLVSTTTRKVQFRRDASQMGGAIDHPTHEVDTRLGLQLSSRFAENWLATVQVVSRQRYDGSWWPDLHWACLTWTPGRDWEFKIGRVGLERMPNDDYANVGYTLLWVRPPVEVFGTLNMNYMDGLLVGRRFDLGETSLAAYLTGGILDEKAPAAPGDYPLDLTDSEFWGAVLKVRRGGFRARASFTQLRLSKNFQETGLALDSLAGYLPVPYRGPYLQALDRFRTRGHVFRNLQLGAAYERGPVQTQATVLRLVSDVGSIPDLWSGFVSFGYRLGPVVPYALFARGVSRRFDDPGVGFLAALPGGSALAKGLVTAAHAQEMDQRTLSAGLRWDLAPTAAVKVQVDRVRSHNAYAPWKSNAASPADPPGWDGRATVISVTLDFVFGGVR